MTRLVLLFPIVLLLLSASVAVAEPVPVDTDGPEPGDRGVARTVITGNRIEEIPLVYLGRQESLLGPGMDLHLVRLEGPVADRVGVAAGMSGSPVWFGGRLIGALAYRMGSLPTEPVAGVTPIEDILGAARAASSGPSGSEAVRPIATPVLLAGVTPRVRRFIESELEPYGFVLASGSAGDSNRTADAVPVEPGSPVGVELVRGDMTIAATGTVTWVEGERVYAFGHPFLGRGSVELPMVEAEVVHTLADLAGSSKLARVGAEIGAVVEDRLPAIVGLTGRRASVIPLTVRVAGGSYGEQQFGFEVARSGPLAPLLVSVSVANALSANPGYDDRVTLIAEGRLELDTGAVLPLDFAVSGGDSGDPAIGIAVAFQQTLTSLWTNPFSEVRPTRIELDVRVIPQVHRYTIEALHYDRGPVRPGESLEVRCALRDYRGRTESRVLTLPVPEDLEAGTTLALAVGSPLEIDKALGRPLGRRYRSARDLDGVIEVLADLRAPHRLTAVLFRRSDGVVAAGRDLNALPPTAERLLSARGAGAGKNRSRVSALARRELALDGPVDGGRVVRLTLGTVD